MGPASGAKEKTKVSAVSSAAGCLFKDDSGAFIKEPAHVCPNWPSHSTSRNLFYRDNSKANNDLDRVYIATQPTIVKNWIEPRYPKVRVVAQ